MASEFDENVLIPKHEYVALKEHSEKNTETMYKKQSQEGGAGDKFGTKLDSEKTSDRPEGPMHETTSAISPGESDSKSDNFSTQADHLPLGEKANEEAPYKDSDGGGSAIAADTSHTEAQTPPLPPGGASDKQMDTDHGGDTERSEQLSNKSSQPVNKLGLVVDKVTTKLREPVSILVEYITENGQGIIGWDDKLHFVYMQQLMPRTNIVRLLTHSVKTSEQVPKGASVFLRALKSIGLENPVAYVSRQMQGKKAWLSPSHNKGHAESDKMLSQTGDEVVSDLDTVADGENSGATDNDTAKKKNKKVNKLEKLVNKWFKW